MFTKVASFMITVDGHIERRVARSACGHPPPVTARVEDTDKREGSPASSTRSRAPDARFHRLYLGRQTPGFHHLFPPGVFPTPSYTPHRWKGGFWASPAAFRREGRKPQARDRRMIAPVPAQT